MHLLSGNKQFFKQLAIIAAPIILQEFVLSALNLVDMIMIGSLGEDFVSAVGIANQPFFLLIVLLVGVGSGAAIFTAQNWGHKNPEGVQKYFTIGFLLSLFAGIAFFITAQVIPEQITLIFNPKPSVLPNSMDYLQIVSWSYIPLGLTMIYSFTCRSIEDIKIPLIISSAAVGINTLLNYLLIFGIAGFPALGIRGAAIATVTARFIEAFALIVSVQLRKSPLRPGLFSQINLQTLAKYFHTALPVILSETGWVLASIAYNYIFAHQGNESFAAFNIFGSIQHLSLVMFFGLSSASSIIVGNLIGAGRIVRAKAYSNKFIIVSIGAALMIGGILVLISDAVTSIYNISTDAKNFISILIIMYAAVKWIKTTNLLFINGILRSGGDTRYCLMLDVLLIWLIGVPIAFVSWKVWGLPIYWIFLITNVEELIKMLMSFRRFISGKWIHRLAEKNITLPEKEEVLATRTEL